MTNSVSIETVHIHTMPLQNHANKVGGLLVELKNKKDMKNKDRPYQNNMELFFVDF